MWQTKPSILHPHTGTPTAPWRSPTISQTVMVVDDYEDIRFMLRLSLEKSGYRVVEAADGVEAIEVACREQPHLILMDLSLPLLDGLAATRRIHEYAELRNVPVVAISGWDSADDRSAALTAGCCEYLLKPVHIGQLKDVIEGFISVNPQTA